MTAIASSPAGAIRGPGEALPARPARFVRYLRETGLLVGRGLRAIPSG